MSEGGSPQTEMTPERWRQIKDLLAEAILLAAEDRPQYVDKVCGRDSTLRAELESLVAAHETAEGGCFENPPLDITAGPQMPVDDCNRGEELVQTPPDLEPRQRTSFFEQDGDNNPMREPVERLLSLFQEDVCFPDDGVSRLSEAHAGDIEDQMVGRHLGAYNLVKRIGQGGTAAVFLARRADGEYQKEVAIKLLQPGRDSQELLNRFRNERQTLADLDHPNIVKLLDGGRTLEGSPFLVMDYVEGCPIDEYCDRHELCIDDRLRLFSRVCEAVQYAHQKSVVHRDLKPSNILVTDDCKAKVLDFGIAKVLSAQPSAQALVVTQTGTRCMTPAYASPEQVRGKPITTATDIYSLGVVLYELLSGHRPYRLKENTPVEIERAICEQEIEPPSTAVSWVEAEATFDGTPVTKTPESVSETRERSPENLRRHLRGDLDNIVLRSLHKEPEKRYASVEEFSEDITRYLQHLPVKAGRGTFVYRSSKFARRHKTRLGAVLVLLLVVAAAAAWTANKFGIRNWFLDGATSSQIHSLGVLPLANLSGDPSQEYFSDGMTDSLITDLSQITSLKVISRTSAMQYKSTKKSLPQIGSELNVDAIVEGTVTRIGERVRITAQLIEARSDRHIWAGTYEDNLGDILALQSEVARAIANQIKIQVTPQEGTRLAQVQPVVPEAYEAYLRGRYFWNRRTEDSLKKALDYFQWAVDKDASYAPAYSGLADSYIAFASFRVSPANDAYIKAKLAAVRALELDPRLPEALSALAMVHLYYEWDWVAAEAAFKRALELNPDDGTTHMRYALALQYFGRFDDALREIARAREADPLSPVISSNVGKILHLARRYEQAIEEYRKAVELEPKFWGTHNNLGLTFAVTRRYEQAIAEFQRAIELSGNPEAKANLAYAYAMCGRSREAREILSELQAGTPQVYSSPFDLAVAYTGLGDRDAAFAWLEKAYQERARPLLSLNIDPLFDPLHSDPRFPALVRQMKVFDAR